MELPEPLALIGMVLFSLLGLWAIKEGRREGNIVEMAIGFVLLFYTYFVTVTWQLWLIGVVLTVVVFKKRN